MNDPSNGQMHFELRFDRDKIYECGALLLTILAAPPRFAEDRRAELFTSLCGRALKRNYELFPDDHTPITAKPQYFFRPTQLINRDVALIARELGKRLVAGRMAVPYFRRSAGVSLEMPTEVERLSVNAMAKFVQDDAGQEDIANLKARIWRPSRRVIHLCVAAATLGQELARSGAQADLDLFLEDENFIRALVARAEEYADLVALDSKFPVAAQNLIRVTCI